MVSGRLPFKGEVQAAVSYGILNEEPEPLTALRTGVPIELDRIVGKALAKSADERYQHVDELVVDLRTIRRKAAANEGSAVAPSIAVVPFVNMNRDEESEFFSDGITEDIINALTRLEGLKVAGRSMVFQFKGQHTVRREMWGAGSMLRGSWKAASAGRGSDFESRRS
jgi:hypothetical protein